MPNCTALKKGHLQPHLASRGIAILIGVPIQIPKADQLLPDFASTINLLNWTSLLCLCCWCRLEHFYLELSGTQYGLV